MSASLLNSTLMVGVFAGVLLAVALSILLPSRRIRITHTATLVEAPNMPCSSASRHSHPDNHRPEPTDTMAVRMRQYVAESRCSR